MASSATVVPGDRLPVERSPGRSLPDQILRWGLTSLATLILIIIVYFFIRLIGQSGTAISHSGLSFVVGNDWDPSHNIFHGAALIVGTLITSAIALIIGVPVAVATSLFIVESCPRRLRTPVAILVDLLAAVPSVVYGLWGVFVLAPKLLPAEKWFASTFSFIPWLGGGTPALYNYFIAGLILAIMILPIVSAISREVIATVPRENKEAALALGATRWEMIRMAVLPYSRSGIIGGAMLGMGRALGETIAVVLLIGNAPTIGTHIFGQGYSLAAVIANEFNEAANTGLWRSSLFYSGLVLFILVLIVNIIARYFISRGSRGARGTGATGMTIASGAAGDAA